MSCFWEMVYSTDGAILLSELSHTHSETGNDMQQKITKQPDRHFKNIFIQTVHLK